MLANVRYRGLAVVEGARISRGEGEDPLGPFVELDPPFPVGTILAVELVREGKVEMRTVRVRRVHEGMPAGIFVQFTDGAALPSDLPTRPQAALASAADDVQKSAPAPVVAAAPSPVATRIVEQVDPEPESDQPADVRRSRQTEQIPILETKSIVAASEGRDTVPSIPAVNDAAPAPDTMEMPAISMEAEPEDDVSAGKPTDKAEENRRGGRKNRKRSKTVIGH